MNTYSPDRFSLLRKQLAQLSTMFLEPANRLQDQELRRKAVLLSAFLLIMLVVFAIVDVVFTITVPGYVVPWYGYVFLLTSYGLNRGGYYHAASALVVVMFPVVVFSTLANGQASVPLVTINFLLPGLIAGSILLSMWQLVLLALANIAGTLLMVPFAPEYFPTLSSITGPVSTVAIGTGLLLVAMWNRNVIEQDRQSELQRSEARMRAMLEAVPDMIFELKKDGTIMHFVPSSSIPPILPPEEFLGKTIAQVLPDIADQAVFAIERAVESGQVNAFEYQLPPLRDKTYEARIVASGPDTVMAMIRDVSLNKWMAAEREKLIGDLEEKNAELERFIYTVSHDLKSPLVTIVGFLAYLEDDLKRDDKDKLQQDVERIYRAAYRMQDLLKDLLELSRVGRLINPYQVVPLDELVKEAIELAQGRLQEHGVRTLIRPDLPSVYGDRKRLLELFQNLIDNAAKYMGEQPKPVIEIGHEGIREKQVILFVRDNGIGIAKAYHEQIFGLFNTLDSTMEGTGIGLAISKRIVEVHGGTIWVDSEPGQGASFWFTLPSEPV